MLTAIQSLKEDVVLRFDGLLDDVQGIQGELKSVTVHFTLAKGRISSNQDNITTIHHKS